MPKRIPSRNERTLLRHQQAYDRTKDRLRPIGFICEGSLVERWMPCGKPNCVCAKDPDQLHGPYFQLSWKEQGKTVSRRLPPEHADLYRQWIRNRQLLHTVIQQMQKISRKATSISLAATATAPRPTRQRSKRPKKRR